MKIHDLWVILPWLPTDVSNDGSVTFFRVKESKKFTLLGLINPEDEGVMVL